MDNDNIVNRLKRYAKVSTKLPSLAARLAGGQYFDMDKERHAQDLKAALGELKGPLMKAAQLLSTIPDALPPEYAAELAELQSNAPAMGWHFVKRRMKAELGPDWQSKFKSFTHEAAAAASLGQVHKAESLKGEALACKLQYPQMSSTVEADLKQLNLLMRLYESYDKAVQTKNVHKEISDRMREELDYTLELKHMRLYEYMLKDMDHMHIPKAYPDLSTSRLLTMTWLEGHSLKELPERSLEERNQIAKAMFRGWYTPLYRYGVIHGDPHLGNYSFRDDHTVNLLDFGCIRIFPATFVKGVIDLYNALLHADDELAVEAYKSWGFENINKATIEVLNGWAKFLYAPVMDNRVRLIDETASGFYGREVASAVHEELKKIGGVAPPREFVFMDRAAIGLGSVFLRLKAQMNWYEEFQSLIQEFDVDAVDERQQKALVTAGLK